MDTNEVLEHLLVIDITNHVDEVRGLKVKSKITRLLSAEELQIFIEYMTAEMCYSLVTSEKSPVLLALKDTLDGIEETVGDKITDLQYIIASQDAEIKQLRIRAGALSSENTTLKNSLARARKILKADEVKAAMSYCEKFQDQNIIGEIGHRAASLAESIKNVLIATKGAH